MKSLFVATLAFMFSAVAFAETISCPLAVLKVEDILNKDGVDGQNTEISTAINLTTGVGMVNGFQCIKK